MASGLFRDPMANPRLAVTKLIHKHLAATWSQVVTSSRPGATCLDFGPFSESPRVPAGSDNSRLQEETEAQMKKTTQFTHTLSNSQTCVLGHCPPA